ncbi:MAG: protein translocase subunit SecD [Pseudomonadota bacterium]
MIPAPIRKKVALLAVASITAVLMTAVAVLPWFAGLRQSTFPGLALKLGLDLQGGLHLVLKVDLNRAVQNQLERSVDDLGDALKSAQLYWQRTAPVGENARRLYYATRATADAALEKIHAGYPYLSAAIAAAEDAGAAIDVSLSPKEAAAIEDRAVVQTLEVMRNRIDQFGVAEPLIVRQGRDEIVIQLPGLADTSRAMALIGKTAQLEFKLVAAEQPGALAQWVSRIAAGGKGGTIGHRELNAALKDRIPVGTEVYLNRDDGRTTGDAAPRPILVNSHVLMTGAYIRTAQVGFDDRFNTPSVHLDFNSAGARLFERITTEHTGSRLAIILDDVVHSAPLIQESIAGGKARITGAFTAEEASDLAIVLRAGALPAPVRIVQNLTVGPSLGQDSINQGINASVLGTALVIGFMLMVYRRSGMIANIALVLNVVFMLAAMALMKATLSLPGIAGIVLSIGMRKAAFLCSGVLVAGGILALVQIQRGRANLGGYSLTDTVVVFDRIRENMRHKDAREMGPLIDRSINEVMGRTIMTSATVFLVLAALLAAGGPLLRDFAFALMVGVVVGTYSSIFVAAPIVYVWPRSARRQAARRHRRKPAGAQ